MLSLGYYSSGLSGAAAEKSASATKFDGTNDWMSRGGDLTVVDSKSGLLSFWVHFNGGDSATQNIFEQDGGAICYIQRKSNNKLTIGLYHSSGTPACILTTATSLVVASGWIHVLVSWDLANTTAHIYINDSEDSDGGDTIANLDCNYLGHTDNRIGNNSSVKFNGCLSEFYWNMAEYLDISQEANRRKFISTNGKPVELGSDGSTPTGTSPTIYFPNDYTGFETNAGTGGNFTVTGALEACASSPSD